MPSIDIVLFLTWKAFRNWTILSYVSASSTWGCSRRKTVNNNTLLLTTGSSSLRSSCKIKMKSRTVARKFSTGTLQFCGEAFRLFGGLEVIKLTKTLLIYSVSRFNLGVLELCAGGLSPRNHPRGNGTDEIFDCSQPDVKHASSIRLLRFNI